MNADPLTYAPFLLLFLLAAAVEIRYWIRNRARMTPKARFRRGLFLAAVPVLCAALWLGRDRAAFWLEDHTEPPYARIEIPVADLRDDREGLRTFAGRLETTVWDGTHAEARALLDEAIVFIGLCALSSGSGNGMRSSSGVSCCRHAMRQWLFKQLSVTRSSHAFSCSTLSKTGRLSTVWRKTS